MTCTPRVDHEKCDEKDLYLFYRVTMQICFCFVVSSKRHSSCVVALSLASLFPGGRIDITAATQALRQIAHFVLSAY